MDDLEQYVIKDDFYNSIKDEITCIICVGIKKNPVMCCRCQNSFCSKCIKTWNEKNKICPFKCSSPEYVDCRIIKNLLSKLTFKCKNNCGDIIPYDKIEIHYDFECKKIDLKEKNKKLLTKYKELEIKYDKLKKAFSSVINFSLDSKIIEEPEDLIFIKNILCQYYKRIISLHLLYRATRDGDTAQKFHEYCDNKEGGILVVFQTTKNVIFGGFTNATWIQHFNPERKAAGRDKMGDINFLFQVNLKKVYNLRIPEKNEKVAAIFCRSDCGPCFGSLGEDIWAHSNFLTKKGILHKDLEKGRKCSFDTHIDYELNNGESFFLLKELEAFLLI